MPEADQEIAIVGMAAVFPGAADLASYWRNLAAGVDAIAEVPENRWDPIFFDAEAGGADRFYCRRGGFIDGLAGFDPTRFGIMPVAVDGAEPDQLLALQVAAQALADAEAGAGTDGARFARDRAAVILGRGGYLTAGMARLSDRVRGAQQLVTTLAELAPELDAATLERVRLAFQARLGQPGPESAIGLVPNLAASRIANRLDLRGPAYTVDAACASSLIAVDHGCRELATGRCDLVVAGGVHLCHDVTFWSVFTQLGALSRNQAIRPFDRRADGILIGEGAGVVVLKRRADAERAGDRIYAVIAGTGVSSDGRTASQMRPDLDGQLAALGQAWRTAGLDPTSIGLLEAHGTGTPAGDQVELEAVARFFGAAEPDRERAALGSVKSMIGHAMPAAGAAGLIKAALAIHHGVLPPTLHCEEPHPALAQGRFRVLAAAEPWLAAPRRAAVSAFGFGGINAHVVLTSPAAATTRARRSAGPAAASVDIASGVSAPRVVAIAGDSTDELRAALDAMHRDGLDGHPRDAGSPTTMRLALVEPTAERVALARKILDRGRPWRGNSDIWFSPHGLARAGSLALVFPGVEAGFAPQIADVAAHFALPVPPALDAALAAPPIAASPRELEIRGFGVVALGRLLAAVLTRLGVQPALIAGHSLGEWTGMAVSELIPPAAIDGFIAGLPAGSLEVPDVVFAAVGCGTAGAEAALEGLDDVAISHDNCPHQSILCGRQDRVQVAIERLRARGVLCQQLPFRSGFHSPLFADYLSLHLDHLSSLPLQHPRIPLWSATTCAPYPDDPAAVRALAIEHLIRPVRFRELIERLYADGVRAFIQVGVGSLVGFIDDTLRGKDHTAIAAAGPQPGGLTQLARVAAALFVEGFLAAVPAPFAPAAPPIQRAIAAAPPARPSAQLALGAPLVRLGADAPRLSLHAGIARAGADAPTPTSAISDPVLAELHAVLAEASAASRAVVDAWARRPAAVAPPAALTPPPHELTVRRALSVEHVPALIDHCFYRQPASSPSVADRYPVVPMTMTLGMMMDAALALAPGRVAIGLDDVHALRWLAVAPPVEIELRCRRVDADHIDVEIPGYARAIVTVADRYPPAPTAALPPLAQPRPTPITSERLYADRWMFHGPRYQGVVELGPMGDDGVDGTIEVLPAPGALLDCAGQLMGWWVMQTEAADRLAMPVRLERVRLYGAEPAVGRRLACRVRIRSVEPREVKADLELSDGDRVWARIDGWRDRRFESDDAVWAVLMYPERNALALARPGGYVLATEHWHAAASRELMMRRYLGERERAAFDALGPRRRRSWLLGRIALKDAVRQHMWQRGAGPLFPVEIELDNEPSGRPIIVGAAGAGLAISVAHKDDVAVAAVSADGPVGVDVERIEPRGDGFTAIAATPDELALGGDRPRDEWLARLWTAKEAVAKLRGTGLGNPRRFPVQSVAGDRLIVDGIAVETHRDGDHVVACTLPVRRSP